MVDQEGWNIGDAVLLSPRQVAAMIGISRRNVLRLGIPRIQLGHRTIRYRKEDVDGFIKKKRSAD